MGCMCSKGISANEYSEKESKRSSKRFLGSSRRDEVAVEVDNGSNEATARLISEGNRENTASSGQTPWDEGERKSVVYEQQPVVQVQPLVQLSQKPAKTETKGNGEIHHQPEICRTLALPMDLMVLKKLLVGLLGSLLLQGKPLKDGCPEEQTHLRN